MQHQRLFSWFFYLIQKEINIFSTFISTTWPCFSNQHINSTFIETHWARRGSCPKERWGCNALQIGYCIPRLKMFSLIKFRCAQIPITITHITFKEKFYCSGWNKISNSHKTHTKLRCIMFLLHQCVWCHSESNIANNQTKLIGTSLELCKHDV